MTQTKSKVVICQYCGNPAVYESSAVIYGGRDYGMIYRCAPCNAYVGVHKGTTTPLGTLANAALREDRKLAHYMFDPAWQDLIKESTTPTERSIIRKAAYQVLADELGISVEKCHIAMFDSDQCARVAEICETLAFKFKVKLAARV